MKTIIEKLGIKKIQRHIYTQKTYLPVRGQEEIIYCIDEDVKKLEQQRNEMLEMLLDTVMAFELTHGNAQIPFLVEIDTIKRITNKPWQQIKELIK